MQSKKHLKIGLLIMFMLSLVILVNAFELSIISPVSQQYNRSVIDLNVIFSEQYDNWSYTFNAVEFPVCELIYPIEYNYNPHDNTVGSYLNLYGSNDAHMRFESAIIPQVPHQEVEICFLLADKDNNQENNFKFRVNNDGIYTIADDSSLLENVWTWKCVHLNQSHYAYEYNITMWYDNRTISGGMYLANNNAESGSRSYYNYDGSNPPAATDQEITWFQYAGNTDWVINLTVITAPQYCPLNNSIPLTSIPGFNDLEVEVILENSSVFQDSVNFEYITVDTVSFDKINVNITENIKIQSSITASDPNTVTAFIETPTEGTVQVQLFDDGSHDDGIVGNLVYGNTYTPTIVGKYDVTVELITLQGTRTESSLTYFNAGFPFHINISNLKAEYNTTTVPLNVIVSHTYDTWKYSLNGNPEITACHYDDSLNYDIDFNSGPRNDSWSLVGDNDIQIRFDTSVVPQVSHQSVEVCFYLYDNSWSQENSFKFRVNDGSVYTILDDENFPVGVWSWQCVGLNPVDFSNEYMITAWYDNRSETGGAIIANNKAVAGSHSYYDTSTDNAPAASDSAIAWAGYADNTDWMINLTVVTEPQFCPLNSTTNLNADLGQTTVDVFVNRSSEGVLTDDLEASTSQSFYVIGITDVNIVPAVLEYSNPVAITSQVFTPMGSSVYTTITQPDASEVILQLYDDGAHNDGIAGDNLFGNSFTPIMKGHHNVYVELISAIGTRTDDNTKFFDVAVPFDINISPQLAPEYNTTTVPLSVAISDNYDVWQYTLNSNPAVTVCRFVGSETANLSYNDGIDNGSWTLNGDNDIQIRFGSSIVPQSAHQSVEVCFYLYDNDLVQENNFQFRVNDGSTIYSIVDDENLAIGVWSWQCLNINPADFSTEYNITAWYETRSVTGGVLIANNQAVTGSKSYFDISALNAPTDSDSIINWSHYGGNTDWMINLNIVTAAQYCPLVSTTDIQGQFGLNTVSVFANRSVLDSISTEADFFWVIDIANVTTIPDLLEYSNPVDILAQVISDTGSSVFTTITQPDASTVNLQLFDDGAHNDGIAGDNLFGNSFTPVMKGRHNLYVELFTSLGLRTDDNTGYFDVAIPFDINISPQLKAEYNTTTVPLSVSISDNYDVWQYTLNSDPTITVCSFVPSQNLNLNYNDGNQNGSWTLNGNNDIRIIYDSTIVPQSTHQSVEVCFYLYDNDFAQENNFQFRINDGATIYSIVDDENLVIGEWSWHCLNLNPTDFSTEYKITAWYENRSVTGGVLLANNQAVLGSNSYFDTTANNPPASSDSTIAWTAYGGNTDWMVNLNIVTEAQYCPLVSSTDIQAQLGVNTISVFANRSVLSSTSTEADSFWVIDITNVTVNPTLLEYSNPVEILAQVVADTGSLVFTTIIQPDSSKAYVQLFDDGAHNDGIAGDGLFGNSFTPIKEGRHTILVELYTAQGLRTDDNTAYFDAETPFDINILPQLNVEYNTTTVPLRVEITDDYDVWQYTLNSDPTITVCSYIPSQNLKVGYNDGVLNSSWILSGDNDIHITYDSSVVPQSTHKSVEVCFYLYDNNYSQENNFQFRINDGATIYSIPDDENLAIGVWSWQCLKINPADFSNEYNITAWYENRSATGGVIIANNQAVLDSHSYFDTTSTNAPGSSDSAITWSNYGGNIDWMVDLNIVTEPQYCPLNSTIYMQAALGPNTVSVFANRSEMGSTSTDSDSFYVIDITNVTVVPNLLEYSNPVDITAQVVAPVGSSVSTIITQPDASTVNIPLFDDGAHNDGIAGDSLFGNSFTPVMEGRHNLIVELFTPLGSRTDDSTKYFDAAIPFDINISPQLEQEYNTTTIPLSVAISDNYDVWQYNLNSDPTVTVCSFVNSEVFNLSYNDGIQNGSWTLNGNNDIHIVYDSSIVPQSAHQSVEVCFYLYDNDFVQENSFQFRVNDGTTIYSIVDDENLAIGVWSWQCLNINPADLSNEYRITAWYENRSATGGVLISNNQGVAGSRSYFDISTFNAPTDSDSSINWTLYGGNTDWMVNLNVVSAPQYCPLVSSTDMQAQLGVNTVSVFANRSVLDSTSTGGDSFYVINIDDITVSPEQIAYGTDVDVLVTVTADTISSVFATVVAPDTTSSSFELFDDGNHNDGVGGDKVYGGSYTTSLLGRYEVGVKLTTPFAYKSSTTEFSTKNFVFDIVQPKDGDTINHSPINLSVAIPTNVSNWSLSIDNEAAQTMCSYYPAVDDLNINFTAFNYSAVWNLIGDHDARINFLENDLPSGLHRNVSFCFYVYDTDGNQENSLNFIVNDGSTIYKIPDDGNVPVGLFTWICKEIDPADFSNSYSLNFWYSNRSPSGGLFMGMSNLYPGTQSQFDNSSMNAPNVSNGQINWNPLTAENDWMVSAIVTADEYICAEFPSNLIDFNPGFHNITVSMTNDSGIYTKSIDIERIDIQNISFYPKSVKPGNQITILANVFASSINDVQAIIQPQTGSGTKVTMYDDGIHNDEAALDGLFGGQYTPLIANPYSVSVVVNTTDGTTLTESDFFIASNTRVAVVYSNTTEDMLDWYTVPTEMQYIEWLTSMQHELMTAGIPFEVINEANLKDLNYIQQYDAIVIPEFRNVQSTDRNTIMDNLETAIKDYGIGIFAFGSFMTRDETDAQFPNPDEPKNRILNVKSTNVYGNGVITSIIANDPTHPSAWRYTQGEVLITFYQDYYTQHEVFNASEQYAYPYVINDLSNSRIVTNLVASNHGAGRAFYTENPPYIAETAIGRDAVLWLLYGNSPLVGVKMTDKTALFCVRVDADVSFDTAQTNLAIDNYLDIMNRNDFDGGWYIPTRHSNTSQVPWERRRDRYFELMAHGHEIGSHTVTHPGDMNLLTDEQAFVEMYESKEEIERELGIDVPGLANPGNSPHQMRLWRIAEKAGYQYYGSLDDELTKGLGYIDDKIKTINLQVNMRADFELLGELNYSWNQTFQIWKDQFDTYYGLGDGIVAHTLWHDYLLDDTPQIGDIADYIGDKDVKGYTPGKIIEMFKEWRKQDFIVNITNEANGYTVWITRVTPDVTYGQITLPPGSELSRVVGASDLKNTSDGRSLVFTFESDTVAITYDAMLWLSPVDDVTTNENETAIINLIANYNGAGTLVYGTDASFGSLNTATGEYTWTPTMNDSGIYTITFNVTDGVYSDEITARIIVLDVNTTIINIDITLNEGWNLISIPLDPSDPSITSIMQNCTYNKIWEFQSDQSWKSTDTGLTEMDNEHGYWIDRVGISGDCLLTLSGISAGTTIIPVTSQWTLVGFPSVTSQSIALVIDPSLYDKIWEFQADQSWKSTDTGLVSFTPGKGYWIDGTTGGAYNVTD